MQIGIIADTHDHLTRLDAALQAFRARGVRHVVHCGDFLAPFALLRFKDKGFEHVHGVLGNNDGEVLMLKKLFHDIGTLNKPPAFITIGDKLFAVLHEPMPPEAMAALPVDVVCYGHTHEAVVQRTAGPLIINPGECCGWLHGRATAAVLDTASMDVNIIELD